MKNIFFIVFLFTGLGFFGQSKKHVFESKQVKVEYHARGGLMDGKYVSHYANGKKKAEGHFKDNLRVGKWNVWDSTGELLGGQEYEFDSLPRNTHGYYNYSFLKAGDVVAEKRVWRNINKEGNPLLFIDHFLFDSLYRLIQTDSLVVFMDEEFQNPRNKNDIKANFGKIQYEIIGYRLKEDWFMNKRTGRSEVRPLGLYPILRPMNSEDYENMGLGWLYFPQVRKALANEGIEDKHFKYIASVDDVFWYRCFTSEIYKETNVYDRSIAAYTKTQEEAAREAERIEIDLIEMEHDVWMYGDMIFHSEIKPK